MEKIAGAICLPEKVAFISYLTANQTIDNRLSGRAAKGATLVTYFYFGVDNAGESNSWRMGWIMAIFGGKLGEVF